MKKLFFLFIAIISVQLTQAQDIYMQERGKIGLSASMQDGQPLIQAAWWINDRIAFAPGFSLDHRENEFTSFNIVAEGRYYIGLNRLAPYASARLGILINQLETTEGTVASNDILFGAGGGAEYFFNREFSIAVEGTLSLLETDEDSPNLANAGGSRIFTGSVVRATVYF